MSSHINHHLISVENISKKFKRPRSFKKENGFIKNIFQRDYKKAVDDISFQIDEGEMVGLIGPNGAGKTVTLKMLSGILRPDKGNIVIAGLNPYKDRKKYVAGIGVVFGQKSQITYDLTPLDTYGVLKSIYKIPDNIYQDNLERFCDLLEVGGYISQPVYSLSMGQKVRAELVCALLHLPKILFLDEATIGIDVIGKEKIQKCLRELNKSDKLTMIFTSHDMKDIENTCDRLMIIDEGKMIYDGSRELLCEKYSSQRIMEVEFEKPQKDIRLDNVICTDSENNPMSKYLHYNHSDVDYNEMILKLINEYPVKDISIREPEIEYIIREIYKKNGRNL